MATRKAKTTRRRRNANTAMVFNPARQLSIGGAKTNPTRRRRSGRRRNPVAKIARRRTNPSIRRRSNPASTSGLLVAAVMAGIGVSLFDAVASRVLPQTSGLVRAGVKLGGAYAVQQFGGKLPLLGKYKNDIALVLAVAGVVDVMKIYVLPLISQTVANIGIFPASPLQAVNDNDDTTAGIYGNASPASNFSPFYS